MPKSSHRLWDGRTELDALLVVVHGADAASPLKAAVVDAGGALPKKRLRRAAR